MLLICYSGGCCDKTKGDDAGGEAKSFPRGGNFPPKKQTLQFTPKQIYITGIYKNCQEYL